MSEELIKRSIAVFILKEYSLVSGGTDNHLVLVNMKSK